MTSKDTEKNTIFGEGPIIILYFLLTADSYRLENFTGCDRRLAVHVLFAICGRKNRESLEAVERESTVLHLVQIDSCVCTPYIIRTAVVSLSHSVCAGVTVTRCTYRTRVLSVDYATVAEESTFAEKD
jgi:hypothetical protein